MFPMRRVPRLFDRPHTTLRYAYRPPAGGPRNRRTRVSRFAGLRTDKGRLLLGLQVRHEAQPPEGPVHQRPHPIVPATLTQRRRSAFQGRRRSQTDPFLCSSPIPGGPAQRSPVDPPSILGITILSHGDI